MQGSALVRVGSVNIDLMLFNELFDFVDVA